MGSQRFCLRWNNHQSNLLSVFDQLLHDEAFVDVTLAVEGQFLKAHKMVLSACSPYFQALFVGHPDKHPIVILKDVPYTDMRSLLDFMYRGEVSVDQDRLTAFLKVAESLRIKGLTEVNEERCDLPTIANSLLNQTLPPPPPPPPPNLHRIQQIPPSNHPHQMSNFSQHLSMNKRPHPHQYSTNQMLNSALNAPKRKRGRPRKLSGSSPVSVNCDMEQDETKMNNVDIHPGGGVPEHLVVNPKQLTVLNANTPQSPQSGDHPSPRQESPAAAHGGEASEPVSPDDESFKADDRDDADDDGCDGNDQLSGDVKPESDDYNNQVKVEIDPKPSTSGQENLSPYPQHPPQHHSNSVADHDSNYPPYGGRAMKGGGGDGPYDDDSEDDDDKSLIVDGFSEMDRDVENNNDTNQMESGNKPLAGDNFQQPPMHIGEFAEPTRPPPQRRRIRRRATSSSDPAEALTEMSVRGLNLFRYASVTEGVYKCIECAKADIPKTFKNKYSFQRHAFLYHEGQQRKVFPCPVCSKEFSRPDKMKKHMKMVHDCFMPKEVMFPPVGYYLPL